MLCTAGCLAVVFAVAFGPLPARGQIQTLPAPQADSSFGVDVALSDDGRALVGASGEDVCGANSGAAYVFERDEAGQWQRTARLVPSDCEPEAFFGRSLALSGDRVLIGASKEFFAAERPNVAYIFERDPATGTWTETARLSVDAQQSEGTFAASVALDGIRALVTARGDLPSSEEAPSETADAPAQGTGAAYVFERDSASGAWERVARLRPRTPDSRRVFGGAGTLDGDRLAVTASPYVTNVPGAVYVFERSGDGTRWRQTARLDGFADFSIPIALDGDRLLVGESRAGRNREGAASLFERTAEGRWERRAQLYPKTPYRDGGFGTAVALSGDRALVTGYDEQLGLEFNIDRVAYVFAPHGSGPDAPWHQRQVLDVGDVSFGTSIDLNGAEALVGQAPDRGPGAAYVIGLR